MIIFIMEEYVTNTSCQLKCQHCDKWFRSGIQFGTAKAFFTSGLVGNNQTCPVCGKMTGCNKENMRFQEKLPDGRATTYFEGEDTF